MYVSSSLLSPLITWPMLAFGRRWQREPPGVPLAHVDADTPQSAYVATQPRDLHQVALGTSQDSSSNIVIVVADACCDRNSPGFLM